MALSGWGNAPVEECQAWRPEKRRQVPEIIAAHEKTLIARGQGRSYGDASLGRDGTLLTGRLDRLLEFNAQTGVLRAQAGVTLAEVLRLFVPRGWIAPVLPGTRYVSLGGAFASNVHGKNHYRDGGFARHTVSIWLRLPNGERVRCAMDERPELFQATAGGMGMTGVIEEVELRLKPIASSSLKSRTRAVDSLEDMLEAFDEAFTRAEYMVGWIDHFGTGAELGRGVFQEASHMQAAEGRPCADFHLRDPRLSVPCYLPPWVLNRHSMALYNRWRFRKYTSRPSEEVIPLGSFFHPLDSIGKWNRLYGKRGFFQYQCVIPEGPKAPACLHEILSAIQSRRLFSYLAVLKRHGAGGGMLAFDMPGYSLALDFPNTAEVRALIRELNAWLCEVGGRVYLAKDALLSHTHFERMYADALPAWRAVLAEVDPEGRLSSGMAERLKFRGAAHE